MLLNDSYSDEILQRTLTHLSTTVTTFSDNSINEVKKLTKNINYNPGIVIHLIYGNMFWQHGFHCMAASYIHATLKTFFSCKSMIANLSGREKFHQYFIKLVNILVLECLNDPYIMQRLSDGGTSHEVVEHT